MQIYNIDGLGGLCNIVYLQNLITFKVARSDYLFGLKIMSVVREFVEQGYPERIQAVNPDVCPLEDAADVRLRWGNLGATVVFMAGVFDVPTPNHRFGLAEARLMGAASRLGVEYATLGDPENLSDLQRVRAEAASDNVKLMVTVDTDDNVRANKGFVPEKGGSPRPIFGWETRAYNLASYTVPHSPGLSHNMVDFITRHGINSCGRCVDCFSGDNALMIPSLSPNLVVVNAASTNTLNQVLAQKENGKIPATSIGITNENDHQFVDSLIGGRVSSTSIIRRAKQAPPQVILQKSGEVQYAS